MTADLVPPAGGLLVLERAARYALAGLAAVTEADLPAPTPCAGWDLRALLDHLADSADALTELVITHRVAVESAPRRDDDPIAAVRRATAGLLEACASAEPTGAVCRIGDLWLPAGTAAGVGAIELAVHGWDVARACGTDRPIPARLAGPLGVLAAAVVPAGDRWPEFGVPVVVEPPASAGDRLLGYLGRRPARASAAQLPTQDLPGDGLR